VRVRGGVLNVAAVFPCHRPDSTFGALGVFGFAKPCEILTRGFDLVVVSCSSVFLVLLGSVVGVAGVLLSWWFLWR
jgi:hypothetical protein